MPATYQGPVPPGPKPILNLKPDGGDDRQRDKLELIQS